MLVGYSVILMDVSIPVADALVPSLLIDSSLPVVVVGALACAILAASMSSGDTILYAAGSIIVRDGLKRVGLVRNGQEMMLIRSSICLLHRFSPLPLLPFTGKGLPASV